MAPAEVLLKKQDQQGMMKDLATEAAEIAAARSKHIRRETEKLSTTSMDVSRKRSVAEKKLRGTEGTEVHEPENELEEKGTREEAKEEMEEEMDEDDMDADNPKSLKDRVPWLASNMRDNLDRRQKSKKTRRVAVITKTSIPEEQDEEETDTIPPPPEFLPTHLQNGDLQSNFPELPPRDYPATPTPNLPPRDYPTSSETRPVTTQPLKLPPRDYPASRSAASSHHASSSKSNPKGVQLDDDYYNQMMMTAES